MARSTPRSPSSGETVAQAAKRVFGTRAEQLGHRVTAAVGRAEKAETLKSLEIAADTQRLVTAPGLVESFERLMPWASRDKAAVRAGGLREWANGNAVTRRMLGKRLIEKLGLTNEELETIGQLIEAVRTNPIDQGGVLRFGVMDSIDGKDVLRHGIGPNEGRELWLKQRPQAQNAMLAVLAPDGGWPEGVTLQLPGSGYQYQPEFSLVDHAAKHGLKKRPPNAAPLVGVPKPSALPHGAPGPTSNQVVNAPGWPRPWLGLEPQDIVADYDWLAKKPPIRFNSPADAKAHVEYVLAGPEFHIPASDKNMRMLVRRSDGNRAVVLKLVQDGKQYRIRSAFTIPEQQLEAKLNRMVGAELKRMDQSGRPVNSSVPGKYPATAVRPPRRPTPPFDGIRSDLLDSLENGVEEVKALDEAVPVQVGPRAVSGGRGLDYWQGLYRQYVDAFGPAEALEAFVADHAGVLPDARLGAAANWLAQHGDDSVAARVADSRHWGAPLPLPDPPRGLPRTMSRQALYNDLVRYGVLQPGQHREGYFTHMTAAPEIGQSGAAAPDLLALDVPGLARKYLHQNPPPALTRGSPRPARPPTRR